MLSATMLLVFVGQAWAPRSWFLPALNVSCTIGESRPERFSGAIDLYEVGVFKGVVMVTGSVAGSCGLASVDTLFRTTITATDATCSEANLVLGDTLIKDTLINFSEQPIEVSAEDVGRGPLCRLAASLNSSPSARARAIAKVLSYLG